MNICISQNEYKFIPLTTSYRPKFLNASQSSRRQILPLFLRVMSQLNLRLSLLNKNGCPLMSLMILSQEEPARNRLITNKNVVGLSLPVRNIVTTCLSDDSILHRVYIEHLHRLRYPHVIWKYLKTREILLLHFTTPILVFYRRVYLQKLITPLVAIQD